MTRMNLQYRIGFTTVSLFLSGALWLGGGQSLNAFAHPVRQPIDSAFQIAQATPGPITEQLSFINTCRGSGPTGLTLYEDIGLTRASGTIQPNTVVTLSGLVASGIAQIKSPEVGWVRAATLTTNCGAETPVTDATLPPDIDTNPQYCRRLRDSTRDGQAYSNLNQGLIAYNTPGSGMQTYIGSPDGPARAATVRITRTPPEIQTFEGNNWIRVKYTSVAGEQRIGWVTNGPVGTNRNFANCLPGQS